MFGFSSKAVSAGKVLVSTLRAFVTAFIRGKESQDGKK
jgi:hypothetical protein